MDPRYEHDCSMCTYLGTWWRSLNNKYYDLYLCPPRVPSSGLGPCLIARSSDEGSDYLSFSLLSNDATLPKGIPEPLRESYYRARVLELI